jgi:phosphomannomutase/phosphoglucomutase
VAVRFGTNGIREVVGSGLTARVVAEVAGAFAQVLGTPGPAVVGTDGRTSSPAFGRVAAGALSASGVEVLELGVLPTPAFQYSVPRLGARYALVVTASHNPPEFNGIKGIAGDGLEIPPEAERAIEKAVAEGTFPRVPFDRVGTIRPDPEAAHRYVHGILDQVDRSIIAARKLRVVLDCGNGASAVTSPTLLHELSVRYTTLNGNVDGLFPGHLSEPTEANLVDLARTVAAIGADFGVAHDGDADRAVFVDEHGSYVPGERMLALLAREAVRSAGGGLVVTPVTSSLAVEEAIRPLGGKILYTRVGSPVVSRAMAGSKAVFGGEENGGCLFPAHQLARDGAMTLAKVLELVARDGRPLSQILSELPSYVLVKRKVPCPPALRDVVIGELGEELAREASGDTQVLTLDGVKVQGPGGWYLIRPSGTEPLFRVFAEAKGAREAESLAEAALSRLKGALARHGG